MKIKQIFIIILLVGSQISKAQNIEIKVPDFNDEYCQTINNEGGICDEIKVLIEKKEKIYFFDTSRIFAQYSKIEKK